MEVPVRPASPNKLCTAYDGEPRGAVVRGQPRIVDLFCGCGGFSLGAELAGLKSTVAIDIDPILTSSFNYNFPHTTLHRADISQLDGPTLKRLAGGRIDGMFGGPPCQAFSEIGQRKPDDPRRDLLLHFFRLVAAVRPAFFVMENVRGLGFVEARKYLDAAISIVADRYELLGPVLLDAANFGAATKRIRLFIVGYDRRMCDAVSLNDILALQAKPATVYDALADLQTAEPLADTDGFDVWKITQPGRPTRYAANLRSKDRTFTGHRKTAHAAKVVARFAKLAPGQFDRVGRHSRLDWSAQCPTLRAGTGNDRGSYQSVRPIHPNEPRVITVREAARLQGFPDEFRFHPTVWHSFRMIGNSVAPLMARAVLTAVLSKTELSEQTLDAAE